LTRYIWQNAASAGAAEGCEQRRVRQTAFAALVTSGSSYKVYPT
jgi:hypothetical protein